MRPAPISVAIASSTAPTTNWAVSGGGGGAGAGLAAGGVDGRGEALDQLLVLGPGLAAGGPHLDQQRLRQQRLLGDGAQQPGEGGAEARPPALGLAARLEHFRADSVRRHLVGLREAGLLAAEAALEAVAGDPAALQHLLHASPCRSRGRRR